MAEYSWPWDGTSVGDAALIAPYDEQEWDDNERMKYGSGGNVGVQLNPYGLNHMEVSERAAGANMSVDVDTGSAMVYGKRYKNTATVNLTIAANASGNDRIDRVVAVWNRQVAAYAGVTPNIDPKTCRVAVLQGTPGAVPAAPALTQTAATVYMIPLAQVYVANAAANIQDANITDEREFCQASAATVMIEEQILTAAGTITFSNIPQCFRHLRVVGQARSDNAAPAVSDAVYMTFNNDGGANYDYMRMAWSGAGVVAPTITNVAAQNQISVGAVAAAGSPANYADSFTIEIPNYRGGTFYKTSIAHCQNIGAGGAGNLTSRLSFGWWASTAAITRIDFVPNVGTNFIVGSTFTLMGIL